MRITLLLPALATVLWFTAMAAPVDVPSAAPAANPAAAPAPNPAAAPAPNPAAAPAPNPAAAPAPNPDAAPAPNPAAAPVAGRVDPATPLITVNGRVITIAEFEGELVATVRNRYYHRAPPEGEIAFVRRDVAESLIALVLASAEARRRGLSPDSAKVDRDLDKIEARFRNMPGWAGQRGPQVARWRADLEERSLAEVLEKKVRGDVSLSPEQVRKYYDGNPSLFTEPEKVRLSLILLKVDPSAGKEARDRTREEAAAIRQRLAKGAEFAELAKIHSGDESATQGGDLGFAHRGSLAGPIQEAVDKLVDGQISEPLEILEGIAIIRVSGRVASQLRPYEAVADRARELLRRKESDEAWHSLLAGLRAKAKVEIDPRFYPELDVAPDAAKASPPAAK